MPAKQQGIPPGRPLSVGCISFRVWLVISAVLVAIIAYNHFSEKAKAEDREIAIDELYKSIDGGSVKEMNIERGTGAVTGKFSDDKPFHTQVTDVNKLEATALAKNVKLTANPGTPWWIYFLQTWGALLLMCIFFVWIYRRSQGAMMSVGTITGAARKERFSDVAGCDEAIEEVQEAIDAIKDPEKYQKMGAKAPRGILLTGPPGTGKTLIAKAAAGECGGAFFAFSGSDFVQMYVGVGAMRVRECFSKARSTKKPAIIFFDEFDAVASHRLPGASGNDERAQTVTAVLDEMDGFKTGDRILVIAATNRPESLDEAVKRPGRFDRQISIDIPDLKARERILKIHCRNKRLAADVNLFVVAQWTEMHSGAKLEAVANEAAFMALRAGREDIGMKEFDEAIDRVSWGPLKKSREMSGKDLKRVAFHEAGHTYIARLLGTAIRKVTILPRANAGGYTGLVAEANQMTRANLKYFTDMLVVLFGGKAGELVGCGDSCIGDHSDRTMATDIARRMICDFGMSERFGKAVISERGAFLGVSSGNLNCSDATAQIVDEEIRKLLNEAFDKAHSLLKDRKQAFEILTMELMEKKTMTCAEVDEVIAGCSNPT